MTRGIAAYCRFTCESLSIIAALALVLLAAGCHKPTGGGVHGSLYAEVSDVAGAGGLGPIFVPDIKVYVKNVSNNATSAPVTTDLTGHYMIPRQLPGTYHICWDGVGYASACSNQNYTIASATIYPGPLRITPNTEVIAGQVKLKDGSKCYAVDPFFGLDVFAKVALLNASNAEIVPAVRANSHGQFIVPAIPANTGPATLKATCENTSAQQSIAGLKPFTLVNLTFPNSAPKIVSVFTRLGGQGVRMASSGATVQASAQTTDPDHDQVHYKWRVTDGSGTVPALDSSTVNWQLPTATGRYTLFLVAYDGKGGFAYDRLPLPVGAAGVSFSGRVVEEQTNNPIAGATVEVNGTSVNSDGQGAFFLTTTPRPDARYVMNIHKIGYALLSQIFDNQNFGGLYALIKAQQSACDPTQSIEVTDHRPQLEREKRQGATIVIGGNSLVDKNGKAPSGGLTCSMATLDPSFRPIPGDYRAKDSNNKDASLVSFGAVFAEFTDAAGNVYNLAPGKTAKLSIPIPNGLLAVAKPSIPLWSYDEKSGFWKQDQFAVRQASFYVGTTTHFSVINTDIAKTGPATCLRLRIDPVLLTLKGGLTLRAHIPTAPSYQQTQETTLNSDEFHALYRLPYSSPPANPHNTVTLELLDSNQNVLPGSTLTVDLDTRPQMTGTNLWPPYPYSECGDPVLLGITMPAYGEASEGHPYFLTGPYGNFNPPANVNPDQMTQAYYKAVDPNGLRGTLGAWWQQNGFNATNGSGGTRAAYLNYNDLGLGRDMHCIQNGSNVACYVTNYGAPDQNPGNADLALTANQSQAIATVAMEYSPVEGQNQNTRIVKFFVYLGGQSTAPISNVAVLDGFGPKYVPQLCTVCHGGLYQAADFLHPTFAEVNLGSSFREFDLGSFKYPAGGHDYPPTAANGQGSLDDFKALNNLVNSTNPSSAITTVINGWYQGGTSTPNLSFAPGDWANNPQNGLYTNVVALSCRTCHIARDGTLQFDTFAHFSGFHDSIGSPQFGVVCGPNKVMPNAVITYKNFWQSNPSRPGALASFSTGGWSAFNTCQ